MNLSASLPHALTLVALSGGADSVALLLLLHEAQCPIEALHCNFHLRGEESNRDERFVTELCQRLGVPLHVRHFDTQDYAKRCGISIEMAARQLRYQWFEQQRVALGAQYIAVAHHRDDQAETLLLNLIRGTGLRGLAAMRPVSGHIIRPLLSHSKAEILDYLKQRGQTYVTDSTNLLHDAQRNRLRLDVIPLLQQINPRAVEHIAQAADRVAQALPYYLKGVDQSDTLDQVTLHERLAGCGFSATQERNILQALQGRSGTVFESPTHRLTCNRGRIVLEARQQTSDQPPALLQRVVPTDSPLDFLQAQPKTPEYAYLDADLLPGPLSLRHPQPADRFRPLGMQRGTKLVSDFLTDRRLDRFQKQRQWLACAAGTIVWVCGLRIDHRYRVTPQTRRILVLKVES